MVSEEQVEEFMVKYFPSCPLCGSIEGWNVSGMFKNYVQCKSCGAKWESPDFVKCKELKNMMLWEASKDGKGASLLRKKHAVTFWQSLDIEKLEAEQKTKKPLKTEKLFFKEDMSDTEIRNAIKAHQAIHMIDELRLGGIGGFLVSFEAPTIETVKVGLLHAIIETNKIINSAE